MTGFSDDGSYLFVEGSSAGVPTAEVSVVGRVADSDGSLQRTDMPERMQTKVIAAVGAITKQESFALDEGMVLLQYPSNMSEHSYEDFKAWVELLLRKLGRPYAKANQ